MKRVFAFLILCLALAVVRVLLLVLAVALLLVLVHAFVTRPKETMVFLGTLVLSSLAVAQPLAFLIMFGVVALAAVLASSKRKLHPLGRGAEGRDSH